MCSSDLVFCRELLELVGEAAWKNQLSSLLREQLQLIRHVLGAADLLGERAVLVGIADAERREDLLAQLRRNRVLRDGDMGGNGRPQSY